MVEVELRSGEIARPIGRQRIWGGGYRFPDGRVGWCLRYNRYGLIRDYLNARGERVQAYNPEYKCTQCGRTKNSHNGKPPRGWIGGDGQSVILCTGCKG